MPTPVRSVAKTNPSGTVSYVKFSDKLTGSINDIVKIIEQNKEMIDSIQECRPRTDFLHWLAAHPHCQICPHCQPDSGCPAADHQEPAHHPRQREDNACQPGSRHAKDHRQREPPPRRPSPMCRPAFAPGMRTNSKRTRTTSGCDEDHHRHHPEKITPPLSIWTCPASSGHFSRQIFVDRCHLACIISSAPAPEKLPG
jgi:hypothetical protein